MAGNSRLAWAVAAMAGLALAGCENGLRLPFGGDTQAVDDAVPAAQRRTRIVERDVEAPQVFSVSEAGLWDGRPSLGGVWVAYPGVSDPERVIIRNPANGNFVIGALFRRERENPGPRLQVSSDAAAALGLLAGQPASLSVTALRREEVAEETETPAAPILDTAETIATETLDGGPATASGAIAAATGSAATGPAAPAAPATAPAPPPAATPQRTAAPATGGRNLLQIGIFSVEANANRAAEQVRRAGAQANVRREESQGKTFWRVTAGPANTAAERDALLRQMRDLGYRDAYFVSR
ncbi:MAG: SPOR domain-containing protein [Gemmobacter sp.]